MLPLCPLAHWKGSAALPGLSRQFPKGNFEHAATLGPNVNWFGSRSVDSWLVRWFLISRTVMSLRAVVHWTVMKTGGRKEMASLFLCLVILL